MKTILKNNLRSNENVALSIVGTIFFLIAIIIGTWFYFTAIPTCSALFCGQIQSKHEMIPALLGIAASFGELIPACLAAYGGSWCYAKCFFKASSKAAIKNTTTTIHKTTSLIGTSKNFRRKKVFNSFHQYPPKPFFIHTHPH